MYVLALEYMPFFVIGLLSPQHTTIQLTGGGVAQNRAGRGSLLVPNSTTSTSMSLQEGESSPDILCTACKEG